MSILWTLAIVVFLIFEASTFQFVCIWFAGGALGALICSLFNLNIWIQLSVFFAITIILLLCTKKVVRKLKEGSGEKTNAEALIGQAAIITQSISDNNSSGEAKIQGQMWSARSLDGNDIPEGSIVTVEKISGVKLIVKNKEED